MSDYDFSKVGAVMDYILAACTIVAIFMGAYLLAKSLIAAFLG